MMKQVFVPRATFPVYRMPITDYQVLHVNAITRIRHLLPQMNLILEVRDSRAPLSTSNILLEHIKRRFNCERLIIYSKQDKCPKQTLNTLRAWHKASGDEFMMIDCANTRDIKALNEVLKNKYDICAGLNNKGPPLGYRVLVAGMPNVGKSTLINSLRSLQDPSMKRKVAKTGGLPGVTRSTSECIRVSDHKAGILIHDTPGITLPGHLSTPKRVLALLLAGCIPSSLVMPYIQADYLLYLINLQQNGKAPYGKYTNGRPTNDLDFVLSGLKKARGISNDSTAAEHWISEFRNVKNNSIPITFDLETLLPSSAFSYLEHLSFQLKASSRFLDSITIPPDMKKSGKLARNSNQLFGI
ncbi:HBL046Wp [Eremothecium sinecaudum]|uniref:HBL046Wp n=1 Tax=Eremothecium sinecaudum TaxID=45286 RepID=A0A120K108_9SACH|nr:HBL046Wp [Eremothecium sinecaudum]AMD18856.1 HBL046Wp [Eremothecium sinecaudum]